METRAPTHGNAVLVVEDDFLVRQYAADVLEENGFAVVQARDADEALAVLEEHPELDVLFTDVNMPGSLDGLELVREVARRWPHIARVVTSGKAAPEPDPDFTFIGKPYVPREVVASIRGLLAERH